MNEVQGGQTNNMYMTIGVVVVLVVVVAIAAFILMRPTTVDEDLVPIDEDTTVVTPTTSPAPSISPVPSVSPTPATSPATSPAAAGQVKPFTVAASNFRFTPAEMRVKAGDTVRITLTNSSTMPHDLKMDALGVATKIIQPGQTDTIEFVAPKAGSYDYYCSVGNHRQMGMVGKLIVE
jgi:plastocyanin